MIPKIIHYCWFGGKPMPENLQNYINGWKEKLPEYEIIEWNEKNFEFKNSIPYVREAYEAKKFAFVSDYVRLWALKTYGGVYLDTDIEIIKPFDELLVNASLLTGFETPTSLITAFIACEKGEKHIAEFLDGYRERNFRLPNKKYDLTSINVRFTEFLQKYGLQLVNKRQSLDGNVEIYSQEVFCGYDIKNSKYIISDNTYTVHHFQMSWIRLSFFQKIKYKFLVPVLVKILGRDRYNSFKNKIKK